MKIFEIIFFISFLCKNISNQLSQCKTIKSESEIPISDKKFTSQGFTKNEKDVENEFIIADKYPSQPETLNEMQEQLKTLEDQKQDEEQINKILKGELSEESKNSKDDGEKESKIYAIRCGKSDASATNEQCQNLIQNFSEIKNFQTSEEKPISCYQILEKECKVTNIYLVLKLERDLAYRILTQNDYHLAINYSISLLYFLIMSLKSKMLPDIGKSPYLNWIENSGYFYDKKDQIVVFSTRFKKTKDVIDSSDIQIAAKQYFTFFKHLLSPGNTCTDIVSEFVKMSSDLHSAIQSDENFPLQYTNVLQYLQQGNLPSNQAKQVGAFLIVVVFCYESIPFSLEALESVQKFLKSLYEVNPFFSDAKEKKSFADFFVTGNKKAGDELSQKELQDFLQEFYTAENKNNKRIFMLQEKIKQYEKNMNEQTKAFQKYLIENTTTKKDRKLKQKKGWKERKSDFANMMEKKTKIIQKNKKIQKEVSN